MANGAGITEGERNLEALSGIIRSEEVGSAITASLISILITDILVDFSWSNS